MLGCFGEVTATSLSSEHGRHKLELAKAARALWPDWLDQLDEPAVRTTRETVVLLNTVGYVDVDSANFAAILRALREAGEPHEEIAVEDIAWLDADSNARPLRAVLLPDEGAVDSAALLAALGAALARQGVTVIDDTATELLTRAGQVTGVRLTQSELSAGSVVVAAGTASGRLVDSVPELANRIPLVLSGNGASALVKPVDGTVPPYVLRTPNRAFACGLHVVPRADGTVYMGATNEVMFEPTGTPTIAQVNFLTTCAVRQIRKDLDNGDLVRMQVGNRPMSIDGWPLIGPTSVAGLWVLTGTYRDGLHLSPLLATEIARRVTGGAGTVDLDGFQPEREPINTFDRTEVLDELIKHTLATGFEVPWHLDPDWPTAIGKLARTAFETLLDELGDNYIPPPEVLSELLKSDDGAVPRLRKYFEAVHAVWH
jgi:glycine/D-amino acid oxidase-like deaminating enzyme